MSENAVTPAAILTAIARTFADSPDPERQAEIVRGRECKHERAFKWENANLYHCPDCCLTAPAPESQPCPTQ